jgi:hypothetical protein
MKLKAWLNRLGSPKAALGTALALDDPQFGYKRPCTSCSPCHSR